MLPSRALDLFILLVGDDLSSVALRFFADMTLESSGIPNKDVCKLRIVLFPEVLNVMVTELGIQTCSAQVV